MAESRKSSGYRLIRDVRGQTPFRVSTTKGYGVGECVTVGDKAYFLRDRESDVVYEYLSTTGEWRGLPPCRMSGCALASIRGKLTTVGGVYGDLSGCLCWDEISWCWRSCYPPAPASCIWPVVATTVDHLIAVEKFGVCVHVMDINTSQWSSVAGLPDQGLGAYNLPDQGLGKVSVAICNETVYVIWSSPASHMLHCSLGALLHSTAQQTNVWQVLVCPGTFTSRPVLVTVNNKLLAIEVGNTLLYEEEEKTFLSVEGAPGPTDVFSMACVLPGGKLVLGGDDGAGAGVFWTGKLSSPADEEERHLEAFRAVMAEKGSLEQTIMHCILFGYPGAGKSSLLKRLRGHPPDPALPSTGVAERAVQVEVRRLTTTTAMALRTQSQQGAVSEWCTLSHDDEAIALMATATRGVSAEMAQLSVSHDSSPATPTPVKDATGEGSNESVLGDTSEPRHSPTCTDIAGSKSTEVVVEAPSAQVSSMDLEPAASSAPSDKEAVVSSTHAHIPPMEVLKQAIKRTGLKGVERYLQQSLTLYITDTGGQLEFQELLPALTAGPTLFFLVFRLDQDLDKTVSIEFRYPDGHSTKPYHSSFTVRETLLQSLASIASMGSYLYNKKRGKLVVSKPRVIFIGTHRDQVSSTKRIQQIDRHLLEIVKSTSLYHEGLIERVSESQLMITVNNLSRDDTHFQHIQSIVERIADRDSFRVSLPSTWLVFSLVIRQLKKRVITYTECFNIAQQCGIDSQEELNEALWFLNTKVGLVRHFRGEGLEDLQDIVIVDPQILFIKITQLIVNTFTDDRVTANVCDEFKSKGIFPRSVLERLSSKDEDSELLTVNRFVKLLEHLHIISRLHTEEVMYFMPCILAHARSTAPELLHSSATKDQQIPPLLITFRCGYCPKGLFSALVVYLLANKMKSVLDWELETERIFRNAISFLVGPYDTTNLTLTSMYLEVTMLPAEVEGVRRLSVEAVCTEVRQCIEKAIREVTSTLNYTSDAEHALAFYCTGKHEAAAGQKRHPAEIVFFRKDPCTVQCTQQMRKRKMRLPSGSQHWFSKHESSSSSPTTQVDQEQVNRKAHGVLAPGGGAGATGGSVGIPTGGPWGSSGGEVEPGGGCPPQEEAGQRRGQQTSVPTMMPSGLAQPQVLAGPPNYMYMGNQLSAPRDVGQPPPFYPSTPIFQQRPVPVIIPCLQNVNPDLRQHPVKRLAGEPRPVQEPTGLQGWPHTLHGAAHSTGQAFGLPRPQVFAGQSVPPSHMPPGLPQPPMLAGQSGPPSNVLTGYHHYRPQPFSGPPLYISNTTDISRTVAQLPDNPIYQIGPPLPPWQYDVNPDLRQHPVQRLAGEPRPVQEPTDLQGWPHPLHSAAHSTAFGNQHSLELTVFQEKRSIIHRGILHNVQDIASRAFARYLIPDRVCEDITGLSQLTANQRTDKLLSELQSRIVVDGKALTTFLHLLSQADACYEPLVRSINDAMRPPWRPAEQGGQH